MDWSSRLRKVKDEPPEVIGNFPKPLISDPSKPSKVPPLTSGVADNHPAGWSPTPKAWLTDSGELRVQGVFPGDWPDGGLTPEIIRLTAGDLSLQKELLRLHVGRYSGPAWGMLVETWQERAAIMQRDGELKKEDAEYQAAVCLLATAFLEELRQN